MKRDILKFLIDWMKDPIHPPLILRGARQVGKTYLVEAFAQQYFSDFLAINFESETEYKLCFDSLKPRDILNRIFLNSGKSITPGKTLLFLDEIQECPNAIKALRYFKEEMPELHVIAAGSLLEFALNDESISMPVGRAYYLYLKPLSFLEYLNVSSKPHLTDYLSTVTLTENIDPIVHNQLLKKLREYFVLGGMPAVIQEYLRTEDLSKVQIMQNSLMNLYRDDFGKYAPKVNHLYMRRILERAPGLIGEHFKYVKIDPEMGSRELKKALDYLVRAGLVNIVYHSNASGLPLNTFINEKNFKLLMLDIGLCNAMSLLSPQLLLEEDLLLINRGALAEQFVAQELLAYQPVYIENQLFYWDRAKGSSTAEVDYVINVDDKIIPIEVKSGKTGSLRSLQLFLNEKKRDFGIRLSLKPLSFKNRVLSIPLYMIHEIGRLVKSM